MVTKVLIIFSVTVSTTAQANELCSYVLSKINFKASLQQVGDQAAKLVLEQARVTAAKRKLSNPPDDLPQMWPALSTDINPKDVVLGERPDDFGYEGINIENQMVADWKEHIRIAIEPPEKHNLWKMLTRFEREILALQLGLIFANGSYSEGLYESRSTALRPVLSPQKGLVAANEKLDVGLCRDVACMYSGLLIELGANLEDVRLVDNPERHHMGNSIRFDPSIDYFTPLDFTPKDHKVTLEIARRDGLRLISQPHTFIRLHPFPRLLFDKIHDFDDLERLPPSTAPWPTSKRLKRKNL